MSVVELPGLPEPDFLPAVIHGSGPQLSAVEIGGFRELKPLG